MPCYTPPESQQSKQSRNTCLLLLYVSAAIDQQPPAWVTAGARRYDGWEPRAVPLLCELLKGLSKEALESIVYDAHHPIARRLADWWEAHQQHDQGAVAYADPNLDGTEVTAPTDPTWYPKA